MEHRCDDCFRYHELKEADKKHYEDIKKLQELYHNLNTKIEKSDYDNLWQNVKELNKALTEVVTTTNEHSKEFIKVHKRLDIYELKLDTITSKLSEIDKTTSSHLAGIDSKLQLLVENYIHKLPDEIEELINLKQEIITQKFEKKFAEKENWIPVVLKGIMKRKTLPYVIAFILAFLLCLIAFKWNDIIPLLLKGVGKK